jgi:putative ABC transport system permease protein
MMGAVWMRARAEVRSRWRSLAALALVIGLGGSFVIGAATGARRADTVIDRFVASTRTADVELVDDNSNTSARIPYDKVLSLPQVAGYARYFYNYVEIGPGVAFVAPADDRFGVTIDRMTIIRGRAPVAADEGAISLAVAQRYHMGIGSEIPYITPDAVAFFKATHVRPSLIAQAEHFHIHVVGIEVAPGELSTTQIGATGVHLTRAFLDFDSKLEPHRLSLAIRLKDPRERDAFTASLGSAFGDVTHVYSVSNKDLEAGTRRSFHLQAIALWLLGGLIAIVCMLIFGQSIARQVTIESADAPALRALGMSRAQLFALGMARASVIAVIGAVVALGVGYALTVLTPLGLARTIEPHTGARADVAVMGLGSLGNVVVVALLSVVPSWRTAATAGVVRDAESRTSRFAGMLASAGSPATVVAGARLAFQRGRGRSTVPVRSSLAGSTVGIAALTAALCFGASLVRLIHTPADFGWRWDFVATSYGENDYRNFAERAARVAGVNDVLFASSGVPLTVDGLDVTGISYAVARGDPFPPLIEGRYPAVPNEIVLGTKALRQIHKHVGESVNVGFGSHTAFVGGVISPTASGSGGTAVRTMKVVGRGVFPPVVDPNLGNGALIRDGSFGGMPGTLSPIDTVGLRFAPRANREAVIAAVRKVLEPAAANGRVPGPNDQPLVFQQIDVTTPEDVLNFGQVRNLPLILAGLLAIIAAATLAHTLMSSIHRRARDLALLKTLGLVRRQVRAVVAWQACFLAVAMLVVGIPVGVVAGRWAWLAFAERVGVLPRARVPVLAVGLVIPATVVLANLLGVVPARSAARTRPAMVLRTE